MQHHSVHFAASASGRQTRRSRRGAFARLIRGPEQGFAAAPAGGRPDGRKANITRQYDVKEAMGAQYRKNGGCLPLSLTFEEPKDYLAVVFYCVGDC